MDLEATPSRLPRTNSPKLPIITLGSSITDGNEDRDLLRELLSSEDFSATPHRPNGPFRKRGPTESNLFGNNINKQRRTFTFSSPSHQNTLSSAPITAHTAVLQARDLLVQAYTLTKSREEQAKLLDLLEVFREYTEKGSIQTVSKILTTQINNLETATRKIEAKVKPFPLANSTDQVQPGLQTKTNQPSLADIASSGTITGSQPLLWNKAKAANEKAKEPKPKPPTKRLILKLANGPTQNFSSLATRNAFNEAFATKGIRGPVVASITKSRSNNLVVTTTNAYTAEFLVEKQPIWEHILPFESVQVDKPWFKVAIHGIPTMDFNTPEGMNMIKEEITIFNKGYTPIGTPYWLTTADKRATQRGGSIAVAFASKEEADRAIRNRLYIAGISVRVEKLHSTAPSTQCTKCQGFGHLYSYCKNQSRCRLCGDKHDTSQHYCSVCKAKGTSCIHLAPICANCEGPHQANSKSCEVLIAIKAKELPQNTLHRTPLVTRILNANITDNDW